MGSGGWVLRFLFGAVIFWWFIWLLFAGILANQANKTTMEVSKHWKSIPREKHHAHQDMNLNNVSKRRVPNGPDPIHNRRASKSRQPPGRV